MILQLWKIDSPWNIFLEEVCSCSIKETIKECEAFLAIWPITVKGLTLHLCKCYLRWGCNDRKCSDKMYRWTFLYDISLKSHFLSPWWNQGWTFFLCQEMTAGPVIVSFCCLEIQHCPVEGLALQSFPREGTDWEIRDFSPLWEKPALCEIKLLYKINGFQTGHIIVSTSARIWGYSSVNATLGHCP